MKKFVLGKKGFIPVILIAVLALVIAVGGVGIGLAWKTEYLDKILPPNIKEMFGRGEKPEEEPAEDLTADWKTFENESFGVSFKYPKTYQIGGFSSQLIGDKIEAGKIDGQLYLSDESRPGQPTIIFTFNPSSIGWAGPCTNSISYETAIEDGAVKILSRGFTPSAEEVDDPKCELWGFFLLRRIDFEIGKAVYDEAFSAFKNNGIHVGVHFKETGVDYEPEIKQIIGTIEITKEGIYGK